jgi:hypothetical protein
MTGEELREARQLASRAGQDAQAVLDVLTAAIQAGEIRKSRLAMLAGLIRRYESGSFDPAPGLHLAERRRREAARLAAQQQREQQTLAQLAKGAVVLEQGRASLQAVQARLKRGGQDYVRQILQAHSRQERQARLASVPFHLRGKVKAHVEFLWRRAGKHECRGRHDAESDCRTGTRQTRNRKTPRCDA